MQNFFLKLDITLEKAEQRIGMGVFVIIIGLFFLLASSLVTALRFELVHHGRGFTQLSLHPFNFSDTNDLRYRILSPLLGYLLFFRGEAFKFFMLFILAVFLGLTYFFNRKEKFPPTEAMVFSSLASFSTLTFHQFYFPAYNDPLSYLLIILLVYYFRKPVWSTVLLSLLLFNHENSFFLFPFFFLLFLDENFSLKNILHNSWRFILAVIPYLLYRKFVSLNQPVEYSLAYYFDPHNMQWTREHVLPNLSSGIFQAFRLFWIFPVLAICLDILEKRYFEVLLILVIVVFVVLQFFIAYDISRLSGLAFPAVFIGAKRARMFLGKKKFLSFISIVILLNFLIPSIYVGALEPIPLKPFWMDYIF